MITNILAYLTAGAMAMTALSSCTDNDTLSATPAPSADTQTITAYAPFTAEYSDRDSDSSYDEAKATKITLSGKSANIDGSGAIADGTSVKITAEGTYILSGTLSGGSVIIDAPEAAKIQLVLSGSDITSADGPAINEIQCDKLFVTLVGDNKLSDTTTYTLDEGEDEPNATLFAKHDMSINGSGTLTVNGNYMHGINTKDDLKITGGTINVTSVEDGIRGRDSIFVKNGTINVTAGGDGIQSSNDSGEDKGRISVDGGTINITAEFDGIQAESVLQINGGVIDIKSGDINATVQTGGGFGGMGGGMPGGGRGGMRPDDGEGMTPPKRPDGMTDGEMPPPPEGGMPMGGGAKGGRGGRGGMRPADGEGMAPADDGIPGGMRPDNNAMADTSTEVTTTETVSDSKKALKSANAIYINDGTITAAAEDDTIHADIDLTIDGGTLSLSSADDAIHAEYNCTINGGTIDITKSKEGIEGKVVKITGGTVSVVSADDTINAADPATSGNARPGRGNDEVYIEITGGNVYAKSGFDGLDSNGNIFIRGGNVTVDSPSNGMDCAIDCDGRAYVYGGTVAASGTNNASTTFSVESEQPSLAVIFTSWQAAGTKITLYDDKGTEIASVTPSQSTRGVVFSDESLKEGKTYTVKAGDISVSVEQSSMSVAVNENGTVASGGMGGGMPMGDGGGRGPVPQNTQ